MLAHRHALASLSLASLLAPALAASPPQSMATTSTSHPEVRFAVDPTAGLDAAWDVPALIAESRRAGRLVLADGAVLRGRVVVDGLDIPAGARVFIAAGTQLISMGENRLDGAFVPFVDGPPAPDRAPSGDVPSGPPESPLPTEGEPPPECPPVLFVSGTDGIQPPSISFVFNQSTTINNQFMQVCAGPHASQQPTPQTVSATGTPSVVVKGGFGGNGVDVSVECLGSAVLTINGEICNAPGERGADAEAYGAAGADCACGGHAEAHGGPGGRAGHLTITADTIRWGFFGLASVNLGGDGGDALAQGGAGGDCPECGVDAGRGGDGKAYGGAAGPSGRVSVVARKKMVPAPGVALAAYLVFGPAPDGGKATAFAGPGGDAVACEECPLDGGDGGDGGNATAIGGAGADGQLILARSAGVITATGGSDGGDGGSAKAQAQRGGHGGAGASCPCTFPGQAGSGGDGGACGSATARGGAGGDATAGSVGPASAGWGGDASADCGLWGGNAGPAGGCILDVWIGCSVGENGDPGAAGVATAVGGEAGTAAAGAAPGEPGDPTPGESTACDPGEPADAPPFDCIVQVLCCLAGGGPGCGDPLCEALVCGQDPFCCEVWWDAICAKAAGTLCPQCGGGGSDCCAAGAQVGCDDPLCTELVCSALPHCCEVQWDGACAELAGVACDACEGAGV